jgi:hypothetical protein
MISPREGGALLVDYRPLLSLGPLITSGTFLGVFIHSCKRIRVGVNDSLL